LDITLEEIKISNHHKHNMNTKQTNAELIDYKFQIMNEWLNANRQETKEEFQKLHAKMDSFIEASKRTYATKEEHEENKRANY
jgi:hypothetical protein